MQKLPDPAILTAIKEIVQEELHLSQDLVQATLFDHLDSIQKLTLAVAIEDRFHIMLPTDEGAITSLDQLVTAVRGSLYATHA